MKTNQYQVELTSIKLSNEKGNTMWTNLMFRSGGIEIELVKFQALCYTSTNFGLGSRPVPLLIHTTYLTERFI